MQKDNNSLGQIHDDRMGMISDATPKHQDLQAELIEGDKDKNGILSSKIYKHTLTDEISISNRGSIPTHPNASGINSLQKMSPKIAETDAKAKEERTRNPVP